jgi:endonuclease III
MEKEKVDIEITTVPNGYALTVNDVGYMYYDVDSLIDGFVCRVGMEKKEFMEKEELRELVNAILVYRADDSKITDKMLSISKENEKLESLCKNQKKVITRLRKQLANKNSGKVEKHDDDIDEDDVDD